MMIEKQSIDTAQSSRPVPSVGRNKRMLSIEPLSRVYSIGWAVSDRSISENDPRFVCAVVAREDAVRGEDSYADAAHTILNRQFVFEVRPKLMKARTDDVSGVLGFLSPWGNIEDREAHDQLERALADIQMWALYGCWSKAKSQTEGRSVILIQGPLLPKVRGRILYRMFDVESYSLYVVSSDPRWVNHFIKGNRCQHGASASASSGGEAISDQPAIHEWTGPLPDLGLDHPMREFLSRRSGKYDVHVAVPANTLPARNASRFWMQCRRDLEELFKSPTVLETHGGAMLPPMLCQAITDAMNSKDAMLSNLGGAPAMRVTTKATSPAKRHARSGTTHQPVQVDLFGDPTVLTKPEPTVSQPLTWEWVTELFELPSDEHLSAKFRDWKAAKMIIQDNRSTFIEALKKLSETGRSDATRARRRWKDEMARIATRRGSPGAKLPDRVSVEDWGKALTAKDYV